MQLAHMAADAYDEVVRRPGAPNPKREQDIVVSQSLDMIDSGHALHTVPFVGCPFCAWGP